MGSSVLQAKNAERCRADFANFKKTSVVIPQIYYASKRVLLLECACLRFVSV